MNGFRGVQGRTGVSGTGPLDWRALVEWMAQDGVITHEEAGRIIARCAQALQFGHRPRR